MSFFNDLLKQMDRSTAGSEATAKTVLDMCGNINARTALFFGDDLITPKLIKEKTKAGLLAAFYEDYRAEAAKEIGLNSRVVGAYEVVRREDGNPWDFIWFNGSTEPDGVPRRFEQLHEAIGNGICAYRSLCWLIDPSLDTKSYVERRFGRPVPLDRVLLAAKEQGFKILDFYISPKSDWTHNFYEPMNELLGKIERESDGENDSTGIGEVNKETYMFELHSEEYSFVYFILTKK